MHTQRSPFNTTWEDGPALSKVQNSLCITWKRRKSVITQEAYDRCCPSIWRKSIPDRLESGDSNQYSRDTVAFRWVYQMARPTYRLDLEKWASKRPYDVDHELYRYIHQYKTYDKISLQKGANSRLQQDWYEILKPLVFEVSRFIQDEWAWKTYLIAKLPRNGKWDNQHLLDK
jgi:hypothetical protein